MSIPSAETSPSIPAPLRQRNLVSRDVAIELLGSSFAHEGHWRNPIVERLGRSVENTDPLSRVVMFDSEQQAIEYVSDLARKEASARTIELAGAMKSPRTRFTLWLARNWHALRRKKVGLLATEDIIQGAQAEFAQILEKGPTVRFRRIPESVSLPSILSAGTEVWVLDHSGFPSRDVVLRRDTIAGLSFFDAGEDPEFDVVVRYRLSATPGLYAYDHVGQDVDFLSAGPASPKAFLSEAAARQDLMLFANHVAGILERAAGLTLAAPAEVAAIAAPSAIERVRDAALLIQDSVPASAAAAPANTKEPLPAFLEQLPTRRVRPTAIAPEDSLIDIALESLKRGDRVSA